MSDAPTVWALLGPHRGDNNQVLALAEALGLPFRSIQLNYNSFRRLGPGMLGESLAAVQPESQRQLTPPWPDLVIGIGRRSVPVARWIRRASRGRAKLVRIGSPAVDPALFDLILTTAQYPVPPAPNVIQLPLVMSRYRQRLSAEPDECEFLSEWRRPRILMAVGGRTKFWRMSASRIVDATRRLHRRAIDGGGSLVVVTSPRTQDKVLAALRETCAGLDECRLVDGSRPRFAVLLEEADELFVTADSVSMLSEAILTGKPVGMIPIEQSPKGRRTLGSRVLPLASRHRDLRRFWERLQNLGLIGTLDQPLAAACADPVKIAADAVRAMLIGNRSVAAQKERELDDQMSA